jgi:hypothetical protein
MSQKRVLKHNPCDQAQKILLPNLPSSNFKSNYSRPIISRLSDKLRVEKEKKKRENSINEGTTKTLRRNGMDAL